MWYPCFLRWLINSKMQEFYPEIELGLNHLFEKGMMVHYAWYENQELKQQQTIKLEEIAQVPSTDCRSYTGWKYGRGIKRGT